MAAGLGHVATYISSGNAVLTSDLPAEGVVGAVAEIAAKTGQDVQSLVAEMVTEAIKMRRVPGIVFADGATGRRARVGGTASKSSK